MLMLPAFNNKSDIEMWRTWRKIMNSPFCEAEFFCSADSSCSTSWRNWASLTCVMVVSIASPSVSATASECLRLTSKPSVWTAHLSFSNREFPGSDDSFATPKPSDRLDGSADMECSGGEDGDWFTDLVVGDAYGNTGENSLVLVLFWWQCECAHFML